MSVRVTALKDVRVKARLTHQATDEKIFYLLKGDKMDGISSILDVCTCWEAEGKDQVYVPEKVGEKVFFKDLIGMERIA